MTNAVIDFSKDRIETARYLYNFFNCCNNCNEITENNEVETKCIPTSTTLRSLRGLPIESSYLLSLDINGDKETFMFMNTENVSLNIGDILQWKWNNTPYYTDKYGYIFNGQAEEAFIIKLDYVDGEDEIRLSGNSADTTSLPSEYIVHPASYDIKFLLSDIRKEQDLVYLMFGKEVSLHSCALLKTVAR